MEIPVHISAEIDSQRLIGTGKAKLRYDPTGLGAVFGASLSQLRKRDEEAPVANRDKNKRLVILVVEDEALLRLNAVDMVDAAGFDGVEAANATKAVAILESRLDICIVFTDIDMPGGLDGVRLAALVRDRWPPIHIILTSGHSPPRQEDLPADALFFPKPIRGKEVVDAMWKFAA
jgi:CheY-like chemotaxis protein